MYFTLTFAYLRKIMAPPKYLVTIRTSWHRLTIKCLVLEQCERQVRRKFPIFLGSLHWTALLKRRWICKTFVFLVSFHESRVAPVCTNDLTRTCLWRNIKNRFSAIVASVVLTTFKNEVIASRSAIIRARVQISWHELKRFYVMPGRVQTCIDIGSEGVRDASTPSVPESGQVKQYINVPSGQTIGMTSLVIQTKNVFQVVLKLRGPRTTSYLFIILVFAVSLFFVTKSEEYFYQFQSVWGT